MHQRLKAPLTRITTEALSIVASRWGGGAICDHAFDNIISKENLFCGWQEFLRGKKDKKDVAEFSFRLAENIFALHNELKSKKYIHGTYEAFKINDPKPRDIHKASVRDRLLHHAIYRVLYPYFDRKFIYDSYSCRLGKGTHRAMNRFRYFARKVSKNNTRTCWVLKCDIKKFFANINHDILKTVLQKHIADKDTLWLLGGIIDSFSSISTAVEMEEKHFTQLLLSQISGKGLPLGNLTSQLLVNIYMNEFDQFVKHRLKAKCYIRYADDFVFLSEDKKYLEEILPTISEFLENKLRLSLHPDKVFIKTLASGVDFLGWVHFPDYRVLRTATKRRMWRRITETGGKEETAQSYLGMLCHGNAWKLQQQIDLFST